MKLALEMSLYVKKVIIFEIAESSKMKQQQYHDNFAVGHVTVTVSAPFTIAGQHLVFFNGFLVFFAEIVYNTENFSNFVWGKYVRDILLFC